MKFIKILTIGLTLLSTSLPIYVSADEIVSNQETNQIEAKAAIAADSKTGQILYAKNINQKLPIASMTKMISMAIVIDQVRSHQLSWDTPIKIDQSLSQLSQNSELSNVPLEAGHSYTVKDLFNASIVQSANAAVMALANKIAGNQENFVNLMRKKVKSWGIKDAYLITSTGLNNQYLKGYRYPGTSKNDENKMTARDVAIVAQHIVNDYPEFLDVSRETNVTFDPNGNQPTEMTNWNRMLKGLQVETPGVDGLKTGTTEAAGACFAGTIKRDGWRIVTVVMNVQNGMEDKNARFVQTQKLMNMVYDDWKQKEIVKQGHSLKQIKPADVPYGKETTVNIVSKQNITLAVPSKETSYSVKTVTQNTLDAPVHKGETATTVHIESNKNLGYLTKEPTYSFVTNQSVEKANIFVRAWRHIHHFFANLF